MQPEVFICQVNPEHGHFETHLGQRMDFTVQGQQVAEAPEKNQIPGRAFEHCKFVMLMGEGAVGDKWIYNARVLNVLSQPMHDELVRAGAVHK